MRKGKGFESFASEKNVFTSIFGRLDSDSDESDVGEEKRAGNEVDQTNQTSQSDQTDQPQQKVTRYYSNPKCPEISISIYEQKVKGIAHQLWPAAEYLADYLLDHFDTFMTTPQPSIVIELGAGLGLTGLYLASLFKLKGLETSRVVLTDLNEALGGLNEHIQLNDLADIVSAEEVFWGNRVHVERLALKSDENILVIAADVVYWESLFIPLADTLHMLCCEYKAKVLIAHIKRWKKDQKFFVLCKKRGLKVEVKEEKVFFSPHEHTGEEEKQLRRIYEITAANF